MANSMSAAPQVSEHFGESDYKVFSFVNDKGDRWSCHPAGYSFLEAIPFTSNILQQKHTAKQRKVGRII